MPISGYVAGGAQEALEEVLDRRLKEQVRQAQEKQHAENIALERQRIDLQQRRDQAMDQEREEDRKWRQQQGDISAAGRAMTNLSPGEISPETAALLRKDPANAPLLTQRKVIDARPIAGTAPLDASGPQQFDVLEPTRAQAQQQLKTVRLSEIGKQLSGATTEQQRRAVGARALGEGFDVPSALLGQTGEEKTAQELADERRGNIEWDRRNAATNAQADARQARSDQLIRERATEAREDKPPTSAQSTLASYAARLEQAEPMMQKLEPIITSMSVPSFEFQKWIDKPWAQSPEVQQYMQTARNMINAVLRRESGAVISPTEFAEARAQYLPEPGNDAKTLELKRQNRALNMATYKKGAGKAYQSVEDALGDLGDVAFEFIDGKLVEVKKKKD